MKKSRASDMWGKYSNTEFYSQPICLPFVYERSEKIRLSLCVMSTGHKCVLNFMEKWIFNSYLVKSLEIFICLGATCTSFQGSGTFKSKELIYTVLSGIDTDANMNNTDSHCWAKPHSTTTVTLIRTFYLLIILRFWELICKNVSLLSVYTWGRKISRQLQWVN